jgi:hypothetical protein
MRPNVAPVATILVGPSRTYHDLWAAVPSGNNLRSARIAADGVTGTAASHPRYRVTYLLDPGTYTTPTGDIGLVINEANVYAVDPTPGSTVIHAGLSQCNNLYWEGVDIIRTVNGLWDPKYAAHLQLSGTTIFANCRMENDDPLSGGGGTWAGMDGGDHLHLTFYGVTGVVGNPASGTNLHGPTTVPVDLCFINVTDNGGLKWVMNGWQLTNMWVKDTTTPLIFSPAETLATKPILHLSGSTVTTNQWDGTIDSDANWPVPLGGFSPYWRTQIGL